MELFDRYSSSSNHEKLLKAVTEELKLPILQIAQKAELGHIKGEPQKALELLKQIEKNASAALRLIDGYLLGLELSETQRILELEPVSLGSILTECAHQLDANAKQYNVVIELDISNKQPLVMGNPAALKAAYSSLGTALIAGQDGGKREIVLASYSKQGHMNIGIFGNQGAITEKDWKISKTQYGRMRQPLPTINSGYSAGIFIADTILRAMSANLTPTRRLGKAGFTASMQLSRQLQFV